MWLKLPIKLANLVEAAVKVTFPFVMELKVAFRLQDLGVDLKSIVANPLVWIDMGLKSIILI